ncbi:tetratricopeptide repeat-containing glycosyltransferase family 2 protein [Anaerophilus nitritogenes]|uniref:tetratricopeptide repeat-containing glycosyltransferase family 2 protein n=1 Tax=Anaerophilus nitritogenes TaxID=2498136 RepID=UPI0013EB0499|nr:TPR domain-containing glycosyltransferase [Anaerophilus nitritogenes]
MLLSLCMIVKNEEKNIRRCLKSVEDIVDEMIIVDTGSTDDTIKIAKEYGAKVFDFPWNDNFSDARNFSLQKAKGDWILIMDADDELDKQDKYKIAPLLDHKEIDFYIFETLSYVGNTIGEDTVSNLNIRLIKNHKGYRYEGAIHEQLRSREGDISKEKVKIEKIQIYHYGYLKEETKEKNKIERNIRILERVIENKEDDFHIFNMANEYLRMKEYEKAYKLYEKIYNRFNPSKAFSPKLLLRMIILLQQKGDIKKALQIIEDGLRYYPKFTDLEYIRGNIFYNQGKISLAIKSLKKCIENGDPPIHLKILNDVGGYKTLYKLGEIYFDLQDYDEAYKYYVECIKAKETFHLPLHRILKIFIRRGMKIEDIKKIMEKFFGENLNGPAFIVLGDIFFGQKKYDISLEYFLKAKTLMKNSLKLNYYIGMNYLYLKHYEKAYEKFIQVKDENFYEKTIYKKILCKILLGETQKAEKLLDNIQNEKTQKNTKVYKAFYNIVINQECEVLSENIEESIEYVNIIFGLLNMLIEIAIPEIFEKSLQLLNLIENDQVLLLLAKIYDRHGYKQLAYDECIRSIKIFNMIDEEGLEIMKKVIKGTI